MAFSIEDTAGSNISKQVEKLQASATEFWLQPDVRIKTKAFADALSNELTTLMSSATPEGLAVLEVIFGDISSDTLIKAFNLRTLEVFTRRYETHQGFQWFVNTTYPMFEMQGIQNPFLLRINMFIDLKKAMSERSNIVSKALLLSEAEETFRQTTEVGEGGVFYLLQRPWLISYLLALKFYRFHYNVGELGVAIKKLREVVQIAIEDQKQSQQAASDAGKQPVSENITIPFKVGADFPALNPLP